MCNFSAHQDHAFENLRFVELLNSDLPNELRWEMTSTYYCAVQLLNAFVADKANAHPETHNKLKEITHPIGMWANIRLDSNTYNFYGKLEMLSRKARYTSSFNIKEKHFFEAIECLDKVMVFYKAIYLATPFRKITLYCDDDQFTTKVFTNFEVEKRPEQEEVASGVQLAKE